MAERTVDVLVPVAVDSPYSYRIPADLALSPGDLVAVPLGSRRVIGSVWPSQKAAPERTKLKPVSAKLDFPPLPPELLRLIDWVGTIRSAPAAWCCAWRSASMRNSARDGRGSVCGSWESRRRA